MGFLDNLAVRRPTGLARLTRIALGAFLLLCVAASGIQAADKAVPSSVKLWEEPLVIPTYEVGPPDRNPIFYSGRTYQGAKGPVYPYPIFDKLTDVKVDKSYKAVYLENEYVKYCILPELGGRIFSATDKTNGYDFVYRQHVIKPALIGMLGAWISGGIEWNIPHHHRASTFMPVDYKLIENADGSKTCWLGEIELRHRMKWLVGLTLFPGRSDLEVTVKIINRTPLPHSILYFANIAVHANENYQVIFPPSTQYGTQHAKSEFVHWPIGKERYGGLDRTGVDLSRWKNHPVPVSIFAWNYEDDFFGGYDHGQKAGIAIIADHHVAPGKKFFVWGNGPEGKMWDRMLTDADGPYIELMAGAWSDNQPDYSWIQPYETKTVKQYIYPIRELGGIKYANTEAAVNLEVDEQGKVTIAVNSTRDLPWALIDVEISLGAHRDTGWRKQVRLSPKTPFRHTFELPSGRSLNDVFVTVQSEPDSEEPFKPAVKPAEPPAAPREILSYRPTKMIAAPMPKPVTPPAAPKDIKSNEELYLTGLRLEQFYSPALEPYPYYEEALRRDPGDYRVNTALGILYLKRGMYDEAIERLNAAVARATKNYTRPKDGEALYYLGVALRAIGKRGEASEAFQKAAWSSARAAAANYELAELNSSTKHALTFLDASLAHNSQNTKAWSLKAIVHREMQEPTARNAAIAAALAIDPLDYWAIAEQGDLKELYRLVGNSEPKLLELGADYARAVPDDEWLENVLLKERRKGNAMPPLLRRALETESDFGNPMDISEGLTFPFQLEDVPLLRDAMQSDPANARFPYLLGNLLYDVQPQKAIEAWEESRKRDPKFSTVHRNLAFGYAHFEKDVTKAIASLEKAIECDANDPRYYAELDVLYEAAGVSPERRFVMLDKHHDVVVRRDDAFGREIMVHVLLGHYDQAIGLLTSGHHFHLWEGGKSVHELYVDAHLLRGREKLKAKKYAEALKDFQAAQEYPENLEASRPRRGGGRAPEIAYYLAAAHEALGDKAAAEKHYRESANAAGAQPALAYYRALAWQKLGEPAKAAELFDGLVREGEKRLAASDEVDFFAKFGGRESPAMRKAEGHYLIGLGLLGKDKRTEAEAQFRKALEANAGHLGARTMVDKP